MTEIIQPSFGRGEIGSSLYGRVDTRAYQTGLRIARNMIVHQFGGISNRPGSLFIGPVKDHANAPRLIAFQFKTTDTHILEFGNLYMRVIRNDGHVTESTKTITDVTQASPAIVTSSSHGYSNDDEVFLDSIVGMTELNGRRFVVANKDANTFELTDQFTGSNIDSTGFSPYSSAGTAAKIFTLTTPYTQAQLSALKFVQTADVVTIVHPSHAPAELARVSLANWTLTDITFRPTIGFPTGINATGAGGGPDGVWKVTAISGDGQEESLPGTSVDPAAVSITGITQASPAVVTVSSHSFVNGDIVNISSIVGMTELNDRHFVIGGQTGTTFQLLNEDSTGFTAWSSAGTVAATFVKHTDDKDTTITWNAVAGASRYRIFKLNQGIFGFIGSTEALSFLDDDAAVEDLDDTPPRLATPFSGADNRPSSVGFHQQRRLFGGSNNNPDTTNFSVIGSFSNYSKSVPIKADDAFSTTLTSREVNEIRHYVSVGNLLVFTSGAEWALSSGGDPRFSIDTVTQNPQSQWGANSLPPLVIGNTVLFSQEGTDRVRAVKFSLEIDGYTTNDLSLLVPHMFNGFSMTEWAFTSSPDPIVYIIRSDGKVLTLTFNEEQEVVAWAIWDTDGKYESVAAIRPSLTTNDEAAYFVVKRIIDGNTVRYIERTDNRFFTDIRDAFFVDSGLTHDNAQSITAISLTNPVVITIAAHGYSNDDEVDISDIVWGVDIDSVGNETQPAQLNNGRFTVANASSNTFTLASIEDGSNINGEGFNAYIEEGKARLVVSSLSNLHHLVNTPVAVLADGNVISSLTVSALGGLTLPRGFSRIHVGKGYISDVETLDPEPFTRGKTTIQGKSRLIPVVTVRFENSRGLLIGPNKNDLVEMKQREFEPIGAPTALLTGDKQIRIFSNWNKTGRIFLRQKDPLPMTILALIPDMVVT